MTHETGRTPAGGEPVGAEPPASGGGPVEGEPAGAGRPSGGRPRLGRAYTRLLVTSGAANLGDGLMGVAVVWLASALTRDPVLIALVGLSSRLPWLLFSLPAGVITDRFDRRLLVGAMDLARAAVVAVFTVVLLLLGRDLPSPEQLAAGAAGLPAAPALLVALCVLALLLGTAEVVRDNSAQTLMPAIVPGELLTRANGRLWGVEIATNQFVGPPLAGVVMALAIVVPFGANAVLLAIAGLLVMSLRGSFTAVGGRSGGRIDWRGEIGEGVRWLWSRPVLRTLAIALAVMNLVSALGGVVFVLLAQEVLGVFDGWAFGLLLSGAAAGAVLGSLVADRIAARLGDARALAWAVAGMGLSLGAVGLMSSPAGVWVAQLLGGVVMVLWNVISVTLRQRIIPDRLLGRVNSVYRFFGWGTISIGTILGGLVVSVAEPHLGREWGLRAPFLLGALAYAAVLVLVARRITSERLAAAGIGAGITGSDAPGAG